MSRRTVILTVSPGPSASSRVRCVPVAHLRQPGCCPVSPCPTADGLSPDWCESCGAVKVFAPCDECDPPVDLLYLLPRSERR